MDTLTASSLLEGERPHFMNLLDLM